MSHRGHTWTSIVRGHEGIAGHRRIVLHTTEGILHARDLPGFFRRVQADSHLGIDRDASCVKMISFNQKSWAQAAYNPGSLSIEQCGFASWQTKTWVKDFHNGLYRVAQAIAHWSLAYGIPIRRSVSHGVCSHKDLGALGGGHWDPGPGYPWRYVLYLARMHYYRHKGWHDPKRHRVRSKTYAAYRRYVIAVEKRYGVRR